MAVSGYNQLLFQLAGQQIVKRLAVLGSTGSIGSQTLDIARSHPEDLQVVTLAAGGSKIELLAEQARHFRPEVIAVPSETVRTALLEQLTIPQYRPDVVIGTEGLESAAAHSSADTVVAGLVGAVGIRPVAAAARAGKTIALANKETLVAAGAPIMALVKQYGARIVPVDSEHSAIHQSLTGYANTDIKRILLTGSGGPFRTWTTEQLKKATLDDALKHPNWSMGPKITIDSSTLMNKGLEIIEARWLFDVRADHIDVVIHPQSILHSAVEFVDGSVVGQMGVPDMHLPIHYALYYPERKTSRAVPLLDLFKVKSLTFEEPDYDRFPCLAMAREVADCADTTPCVLNAANEVVVQFFLQGAISFSEIPTFIRKVVDLHQSISQPSLDDILEADRRARVAATDLLGAAVR